MKRLSMLFILVSARVLGQENEFGCTRTASSTSWLGFPAPVLQQWAGIFEMTPFTDHTTVVVPASTGGNPGEVRTHFR